jgi:CBS domain-containing protein/nucleotide-binding universal stress UspA family protein
MKLKDAVTYELEVTNPTTTVAGAAEQMNQAGIGFLPVMDGSALVGVITDRDITVRAVAKGRDTTEILVGDTMTHHAVTCYLDQPLTEIAALTETHGIHRMPVLNRNDRLVGVISLSDLAIDVQDKRLVGEVLEHIASRRQTPPGRFAKIAVALDGSRNAERILPYVESLAKQYGSTITLMRAMEQLESLFLGEPATYVEMEGTPVVPPTPITKDMRYDAIKYLTALEDRLRSKGFKVVCEYPEGPTAQAIVRRCKHLGVDLIALTTHGRSGLRRAVNGSVADEVLRTAECPVLLARIS